MAQEDSHRAVQDARDSEKRGQLVAKLAGLAHDDWRAPRKIAGTDRYEPRIKKTKDQAWIDLHGGRQEVDIANTPYSDLPSEWQAENRASAEIAINEVLKAAQANRAMDEPFVETVSAVLHQDWVVRNGSWAAEELKKPYMQLPEEEKEKDRYFVRRAIEVYRNNG
jgi:hypothetical protein